MNGLFRNFQRIVLYTWWIPFSKWVNTTSYIRNIRNENRDEIWGLYRDQKQRIRFVGCTSTFGLVNVLSHAGEFKVLLKARQLEYVYVYKLNNKNIN